MATPNISDEEIQFRKRARRRLVGAIVLVLLVVVVVPWILPADKPQQDTQQIDIRIPAQDASGYAPKVLPAPAAPKPAVQAASTPEPAGETAATAQAPEATAQPAAEAVKPEARPAETKPEPKAEPKVEAKSEPKPKVEAKPAAGPLTAAETFYVQYGAFAEAKNAKQKQAELKTKGIATYTEVVKTASGDKIRVRSGPYVTREAAEKVRQKAKPLDSKLVIIGGKA